MKGRSGSLGDVLRLASQIPQGKVSTYGALAEALGDKRLSRYVGWALSKNPRLTGSAQEGIKVPCHRVVCSDGRVGGYKLGVKEKIVLLEMEGVKVKSNRIVDFNERLYTTFNVRRR